MSGEEKLQAIAIVVIGLIVLAIVIAPLVALLAWGY